MGKCYPVVKVFVQSFEEHKCQVEIFFITTSSGSTWTEVRDHEDGNSKSVTSVSITVLHGIKILEAVKIRMSEI